MQPKRPRFNPLILALALAGVLMIWSVLGTSDSSTGGSTMSYSTVVHYFENIIPPPPAPPRIMEKSRKPVQPSIPR